MNVKLEIDNKTIAKLLTAVVIYVAAIGFLWSVRQALVIVLLSFFLALALNPPVSYITSKLPGKSRALGTATAFLSVVVLIGGFVYLTFPPIINETRDFVAEIPEFVDEIQEGDGPISEFVRRYELDLEAQEFVDEALDQLGARGSSIITSIGQVGNAIFLTLTVLIITFFMLVEGPGWLDKFWRAYPERNRKEHQELANKMYGVVTGYINGQLLIALIAGVTSMVAMLLLGVPFAVPLAGIVAMTGLIPMIGATLGAVVVVIVSMFESLSVALVMAIFFLIYQWIENNFIQPQIQARALNLSPLLVLVAVIFGFMAGGLLGGFVSIPIAGCAKVILDYHLHNRSKEARLKSAIKPDQDQKAQS